MTSDVKILIGIAAGALVILVGAKAVSYLSHRRKAPGLRNVALLGDSMSAGHQYRQELELLLGPDSVVQSFGYPNKQTTYIMNRVHKALSIGPSDVVVLAGVNDLASGHSASHVIKNLDIIYTTIRAKNARVIAVTLTPWAGHYKGKNLQLSTQEVNDWIRFAAPVDAVVSTAAMSDAFSKLHPDLDGGDGLHLNTQGQVALAMVVFNQGF